MNCELIKRLFNESTTHIHITSDILANRKLSTSPSELTGIKSGGNSRSKQYSICGQTPRSSSKI